MLVLVLGPCRTSGGGLLTMLAILLPCTQARHVLSGMTSTAYSHVFFAYRL